jgi:cap1 methyltransferase
MSLVGANEHGNGTPWKMSQMCHQSEGFEANYHVSGGADGSGDLYNWANVGALARGIEYDMHFAKMRPQKVHLVVADGGFDLQRDSECQEEISQKLILCEIAAALYLLQTGGTFIIKMFGFRTLSVRSAMRDLHDYFDQILILKPISSRPASSERYIVCTGFRGLRDFDGTQWMDS